MHSRFPPAVLGTAALVLGLAATGHAQDPDAPTSPVCEVGQRLVHVPTGTIDAERAKACEV